MKNDYFETWERLITPFLFAAGAQEVIFRVDSQPLMPKPTVTATLETPVHKIKENTLTGGIEGTKHAFKQSVSILMMDGSISSCTIRERT